MDGQIEKYMKAALKEAEKAAAEDEVPVGAVAVCGGKIIAKAHNKKEQKSSATRHAEIELLEKAAAKIGNWWLEDVDVFVTLEPCAMCTGAMINARIRSLYFGAWEPKTGCCGSLYDFPNDKRFNHNFPVHGGIMAEECSRILSDYFKGKRIKRQVN